MFKHQTLNNAEELRRLYVDERMSLRKIASHIGVANGTMVRRALLKHGIPIRTISEGRMGVPAPNKGKQHSEATRKKISASKKGKSTWTPERRAALSETMKKIRPPTERSKKVAGRRDARRIFTETRPCKQCGGTDRVDRHHKDENTHNNTPENIEFLCRACHMRLHASLKLGQWSRKHECCVSCGRTSIKHSARGLCASCYVMQYRARP